MCFDVDGYAECYDTTVVKTRKPHQCEGCGKVFPPGSQMQHETGLWDGHWFSRYTCLQCQRVILSIAAEELQHGCSWAEAWCPAEELQSYLADRRDPVPLLGLRTLDDCRRYLNDLHLRQVGWITLDMMM